MSLAGEIIIQRTHYDILSVKEDANYEEIRASYRAAILDSHPDKLQGITKSSDDQNEVQERFLNVQKAWQIIGDSRSRALYDHELWASRQKTEIVDVDLSFEEMLLEAGGDVLELFYQCRCGDYFVVDADELQGMGILLEMREGESKLFLQKMDDLPTFVIIPCGSCSLQIRFFHLFLVCAF